MENFRCADSTQSQGSSHSALIEDFLNQTFQKENEPVYRCPTGTVPAVEMYDSEAAQGDTAAGQSAVLTANNAFDHSAEILDPGQKGLEYLNSHKSPTEIASQYAKNWQEGRYQFFTPFLNDIYHIAKNSDDKAATLKQIQDTMNQILKDDPKDTEVALDLRADGTVLVRFGDRNSFYRRIVDLKEPFHYGNSFSWEDY